MANVIYQSVAGRLWINGKDIPLDDCVMSYIQDGSIYKISIRSSSGNHSWLSNVPLTDIEDNVDGTYPTLNSWITWWNNLSMGTGTTILDNNGQVVLPTGTPRRITATLTRPANTTTYDANDNIGAATAEVKQKDTVTLTGTEGSVNISIPNVANRTIAFDTDLTTTAAAFVTTYAADFLPTVVVTSSGDDIIFEAATAGVPFSEPVVTNISGDLDGTVANTTANVTFAPITFESCARVNGGGGFISDITIVTDAVQFAGKTVVLALFNTSPSGIVGDGTAYVDTFANAAGFLAEFQVEIGAALGSSAVKGTLSPVFEFLTANNNNDLYGLLYVTGSVTTPKSAGVFYIHLNIVQL